MLLRLGQGLHRYSPRQRGPAGRRLTVGMAGFFSRRLSMMSSSSLSALSDSPVTVSLTMRSVNFSTCPKIKHEADNNNNNNNTPTPTPAGKLVFERTVVAPLIVPVRYIHQPAIAALS